MIKIHSEGPPINHSSLCCSPPLIYHKMHLFVQVNFFSSWISHFRSIINQTKFFSLFILRQDVFIPIACSHIIHDAEHIFVWFFNITEDGIIVKLITTHTPFVKHLFMSLFIPFLISSNFRLINSISDIRRTWGGTPVNVVVYSIVSQVYAILTHFRILSVMSLKNGDIHNLHSLCRFATRRLYW